MCLLPTSGTCGFHTVGVLTADQLQGQESPFSLHYLVKAQTPCIANSSCNVATGHWEAVKHLACLTLTGLRTSLLLPWTAMSDPLTSTLIWIKLASSRATMSRSLRDSDQCNCSAKPNTHSGSLHTHLQTYMCIFIRQSQYWVVNFIATSLFQMSWGTCLITWRDTTHTSE